MKDSLPQPRSVIPRCLFLSLLLPLSCFILFSFKSPIFLTKPVSGTTIKDPTRMIPGSDLDSGISGSNLDGSNLDGGAVSGGATIRIRPGYTSYDNYIRHQLQKTTNPKLRKIWTTRDWERKIRVFTQFFSDLKNKKLISNSSKALCVGARVGQEVEALRRVGVSDSIGLDLVPYPPLVIQGDFHSQPFDDELFDFEFSNVFDHALYPDKFVMEIQRTLKVGGVCVLHVAIDRRSDKYSANDLDGVEPLIKMFNVSEFVYCRKVDGFGLDTEVVFRKMKAIHGS